MNVLIVNLDEVNKFDISIDRLIGKSDDYNFIIYEIDDEETIKNRICAGLKTLPNYLFFYKNDKYLNNIPVTVFSENQEIKVFDLLNYIIKNINLTFNQLRKNEHVKQILDMKMSQKFFDIIYLIAKPMIIYNKEYESFFTNDQFNFGAEHILSTLIEEFASLYTQIKYNDKNKDKKDKVDLTEIEKNYEYRIVKDKMVEIWNNMLNYQQKDDKNIKELSKKSISQLKDIKNFQEIEPIPYTPFTTDKTEMKIELDLNNISLLEIFNNIELSADIMFAKCEDFYKIFIGTIPKIEWLDTIKNEIVLKLKTKKKDVYIDIKIEKIVDVKKKDFNKCFMTFKFSQIDFTQDEIIKKIFSMFKRPINAINIESIDINGVFYIPFNFFSPYSKYIFSDLIMNDDFVNIMLTIDESDKADKTQFHVHYNNMITGQISARITSQKIKKEKDIVKYGLEGYELDMNSQFLRIKISKCNNLESVITFQKCLSKILQIYLDNFNDIFEYYQQFYDEEEFQKMIYNAKR